MSSPDGFDVVHHVTYGSSWLPAIIPLTWRCALRLVNAGNFVPANPWWLVGRSTLPGFALETVRTIVIGSAVAILRSWRRRLLPTVVSHGSPREPAAALPRSEAGVAAAEVLSLPLGGLPVVELEGAARLASRSKAPPHRPLRLLCLGRLEAWKGFEYAVRAMPMIDQEVELLIVGSGREHARLIEVATRLGVADRVTVRGWVERDEVPTLFSSVDLLVHPSLREHFGYVVLEAMAHGVPPIVCAGTGPASIVGSVPELIVPPRRRLETELAFRIERLLTDHALLRDLGDAVQLRAQRFSWDELAEGFSETYADLLTRGRASAGGQ